MENINNILENQNNTDNSPQNVQASGTVNQIHPMQPTKSKRTKKSIVIRVIAAVAICIALVAGFFAYKIISVNIVYKGFREDYFDNYPYSKDIKDAKYLILNIDYPIIVDDEYDKKLSKDGAFQTALANADNLAELKKFYNIAIGKIDDETILSSFVYYAINNDDVSSEQVEYICGAMDECVSRISEFKAPKYEIYKNKSEAFKSIKIMSVSINKYYFLQYCGLDNTQVKNEIFNLMETKLGITDSEEKERQFEALCGRYLKTYEYFEQIH